MTPRIVTLCVLLLAAAGTPAAAQADPFARCEQEIADDWNECGCLYGVDDALRGEATERLASLHRESPDNPCFSYFLGRLHLEKREPDTARPLLDEAVRGYADRGMPQDEGYARINRADALEALGASGEALLAELTLARRAAEAADDSLLEATVTLKESRLLRMRDGDVGEIEASLREVKREVFDQAHDSLQRDILFALADLFYDRGRFREAETEFRQAVEVTRRMPSRFPEARARHGLAAAVAAQPPFADPARRDDVERLLDDAIQAAEEAGNVWIEVDALKRRGRLRGGDDGQADLERALETLRSQADKAPVVMSGILAASVMEMLDDVPLDRIEARRRLDESFALLADTSDPWDQVYGWADRLQALWELGSREEALAAAERTLALVDHLEQIQTTETARGEVKAVWSEIDQWLAGRLLLEAESASTEEGAELLETAFTVSERMRARLLLESLTNAGVEPAESPDPGDRSAWLAVQRGIVRIQRRLLDPTLPAGRENDLKRELEILEAREDRMAARHRLQRAELAEPQSFVTLGELRDGLAPNEAVLAFQVGSWEMIDRSFGGGSWLLVITARSARLHRLPDRSEIDVQFLLDALERSDGWEVELASGFHDRLLGTALDDLPEEVDRLVVLPDGPLHRLPFAALRGAPDEPPLAERYEIFVAPSATVWRRLREMGTAGGRTLALADPALTATMAPGGDGERSGDIEYDLGPLPHTRRDGRSAVRYLGLPGRLLLGGEATEAAVKAASGGGVVLLHLGTHSRFDEAYPHRSAVVLASGGADEDGRLRPREAARLDLRGTVVVLASCQSAEGTVLRGEGALSLARAFLEGGARAVVGSLWDIDDRDAADVFERFYRHLGRGETVARALALAQRESLAAGDPASAWAGLVVMGDGDAVVVPEPRPAMIRWLRSMGTADWLFMALAILLAGIVGALTVRSLRRRLAESPSRT